MMRDEWPELERLLTQMLNLHLESKVVHQLIFGLEQIIKKNLKVNISSPGAVRKITSALAGMENITSISIP